MATSQGTPTPFYAGHNQVYETLRGTDAVGWDRSDAAYEQRFRDIAGVLPRLKLPSQPATLELGCGAGNLSVWLSRQGHRVTGIDIAPTAIDWARERAGHAQQAIRFIVGDLCTTMRELPAEFDFVFDSHLLHCIIGEDRLPLLCEIRRVLRPGGVFLVDTMCGPVHRPAEVLGFDPVTRICIVRGIATRTIGDVPDLEAELRAAGFTLDFTEVYETGNTQTVFIACREPTRPDAEAPF